MIRIRKKQTAQEIIDSIELPNIFSVKRERGGGEESKGEKVYDNDKFFHDSDFRQSEPLLKNQKHPKESPLPSDFKFNFGTALNKTKDKEGKKKWEKVVLQ